MTRCPKRRYRTKAAADEALVECMRSDDPRRFENHTYRCAACKGWHLSSHPKITGRRQR